MNTDKIKKLEKKGWAVGNVKDFLNLTDSEQTYIELRIKLGELLKEVRKNSGYSQEQLAKEIHSSQSRVAKMEKGDTSVTIDAIIRSLLYLDTPRKALSKVIEEV